MAKTTFDEFVQREQDTPKLDWIAEKEEWLRSLEKLFARVQDYLSDYVNAGQISIDFREIELNEEQSGPYKTREMIIVIGRKTIKLEPVGTFIIGSKGRVDVVGPMGRVLLLLIDSEVRAVSDMIHVSISVGGGPPSPPPRERKIPINWTWKIVTRTPNRQIAELNKENFLNLLTEIANG